MDNLLKYKDYENHEMMNEEFAYSNKYADNLLNKLLNDVDNTTF